MIGNRVEDYAAIFREKFGEEFPLAASIAPGRVNLLGEHTDYNDGFVFPMAVDYETVMIGSTNDDKLLEVFSVDFKDQVQIDLDTELSFNKEKSWINYILGIIQEFRALGHSIKGTFIVFGGDVPQSSGLSSSASVEVACARLIRRLNNITMDEVELVKLCQRAENHFVGVQCGIMDQFVSNLGDKDKAMVLDCRDYTYDLVPFKLQNHSILIVNTLKPRQLVESAYNTRRAECEQGVEILQSKYPEVKALRDAELNMLEAFQSQMPDNVFRRCRHVISDNQRVLKAKQALAENDLETFGQLLYEGHQSLREDYEVTGKELDTIIDESKKIPGVLGARMTGAGFGGCAITLIENNAIEEYSKKITQSYKKIIGHTCEIYKTTAANGAQDYFL